MALRKCPRCELNYIKDDEKYCNVCRREMKGGDSEPEDSIVMCSECGENPAVKGSDLCAICLREARRQEMQSGNVAEPITDPEELVLGSVGLDEIEVPMPSDGEIPESELSEIDKELSSDDDLDDEEEEEERDFHRASAGDDLPEGEINFCPYCGSRADKKFRFCQKCGKRIR